MGLTAGVMITLSFLELVKEAWELAGIWIATLGFGLGALFMLVIDISIPHIRFGERETPTTGLILVEPEGITQRSRHTRHRMSRHQGRAIDPHLYQTGILLAIGITIHNLPEGIAIGAGYMHSPEFGLFIALAILLHNIPEGVATALPLYTSGVSQWRSFQAAFFSGLAEPIGALAAVLFLFAFESLVPAALAFAGGVMMFITLDELVPVAREHGHQHFTAVGIILGAIFVFILSGIMEA
jgi:ZIP family zinc transporter